MFNKKSNKKIAITAAATLAASAIVPAVVFAADTTDATNTNDTVDTTNTNDTTDTTNTNETADSVDTNDTADSADTNDATDSADTNETTDTTKKPFPDVKDGKFYTDAVNYLADQKFVQGDKEGNFNPESTITRAAVAEVIAKAGNLTSSEAADFSDLTPDAWYMDSVNAVVANEIMNGTGKNQFSPKMNVTRAQAAKIIVDAYDLAGEADLSSYPDEDEIPSWAIENDKNYVAIAVENGVLNGRMVEGEKVLASNADITRGEFAVMVKRAIDKVAEVTVADLDAITVEVGSEVNLPEKVEVTHYDGTTEEVSVDWNEEAIDFTKADSYDVEGTIAGTDQKASLHVVVEPVEFSATGSISEAGLGNIEFSKALNEEFANLESTEIKQDIASVAINDKEISSSEYWFTPAEDGAATMTLAVKQHFADVENTDGAEDVLYIDANSNGEYDAAGDIVVESSTEDKSADWADASNTADLNKADSVVVKTSDAPLHIISKLGEKTLAPNTSITLK